jgi:pimeloyl-ACP methyl ester carboxylesterase
LRSCGSISAASAVPKGTFDHGQGELSDAAAALDWVQTVHPDARACWIAGFSFGAWIGMQLLMRRPEVEGFISVAPPANLHDFSFLAPCPSSGLIIHGENDKVVPQKDVQTLVDKLKTQKGIVIDHQRSRAQTISSKRHGRPDGSLRQLPRRPARPDAGRLRRDRLIFWCGPKQKSPPVRRAFLCSVQSTCSQSLQCFVKIFAKAYRPGVQAS